MRKRSILNQLGVVASVVVLGFIAISTVWNSANLYHNAVEELEVMAVRESNELSLVLGLQLWNLDERAILDILRIKAQNPAVVSIRLNERDGKVWIVGRTRDGSIKEGPGADFNLDCWPVNQVEERPVKYNDQILGQVTLQMSMVPLQMLVGNAIRFQVLSQFLLYVAVMGTLFLSWRRVGRRLTSMVSVVKAFADNEAGARMETIRDDELGYLAQGFNTMADQVFASTQAMEHEIQDRTESLVEAEKMALLGGLVAGVAHEINTPVGNCVTVSSWLAERIREIQTQVAYGGIDLAELQRFLKDAADTMVIVESSLARTANLIQAFKKIGSDQVVDEQVEINLASFLDNVRLSLYPTYKHHAPKMRIDCLPGLSFSATSGTLYQIVSNLVINAYFHAFPDNRPGTITISAHHLATEPEWIKIIVADDGIGMDAETSEHVFQPFFTTRRNQGGTGLGLAIVWNLVKGMNGSIVVETAPGQGAAFIVRLPCSACTD